jgi:hypothetical protein
MERTLGHEVIHARLGRFEGERVRWFTEASATYFQLLTALNRGQGDFSSFLAAVRVAAAEDVASLVLAERSTWPAPTGAYRKGPHVLAALDAKLRAETDGRHSLRDVLRGRYGPNATGARFDTYAGFRSAVVAETGVASLGPWLDRYVRTDALPEVPADPHRFVMNGSVDSDGDGESNADERAADTNPFGSGSDEPDETDARVLPVDLDPAGPLAALVGLLAVGGVLLTLVLAGRRR